MRRNVNVMVVTALALILMLSGCGVNVSKVVVTAPIATETQRPKPQPEVYIIDGALIYRQSDEGGAPIYNAAEYFEKGWNCWIENLLAEDGVLYFTEGGILGDNEEDSVHRIIRIDEYGRTVLDEKRVNGYTQLVPYGDRIIFVQDGFDSQDIGWANKDGSASAYLDFSGYAAQYGVEAYYNGATLRLEDGLLYADISFFVDADPEIADHTVSISKDLEITRVK
jgi:hypothetical protein